MTSEQFKEKIRIIISGEQDYGKPIQDVIMDACLDAMSSEYAKGTFLNAADNNMMLPKIVLCAVLEELAWQYEPLNGSDKKKVKQIKPNVRFHYSTVKK